MERGWPWAGCAMGTELVSLQAGGAPPENEVCCGSAVDSQSINKQCSSLLIPVALGLVAWCAPQALKMLFQGNCSAVDQQIHSASSQGMEQEGLEAAGVSAPLAGEGRGL